MQIPIDQLSADTLRNIVEAFVLREGTDYGEHEISLNDKVDQVIAQLRCGDAVMLYSELHETVDIVSREHFARNGSD